MSKLFKIIFIVFFCFSSLGLFLKNNPVEVRVDKRAVETGEVFAYTIKIEGYFFKPRLILPEFNNFKVASQSQSRNYSVKDGKTKVIVSITVFLFAQEPGVFKIAPVIVEDKERKYRSRAVKIRVGGKPLEEKKKILPYIKKGQDI